MDLRLFWAERYMQVLNDSARLKGNGRQGAQMRNPL
jgi:hypothetical protein